MHRCGRRRLRLLSLAAINKRASHGMLLVSARTDPPDAQSARLKRCWKGTAVQEGKRQASAIGRDRARRAVTRRNDFVSDGTARSLLLLRVAHYPQVLLLRNGIVRQKC